MSKVIRKNTVRKRNFRQQLRSREKRAKQTKFQQERRDITNDKMTKQTYTNKPTGFKQKKDLKIQEKRNEIYRKKKYIKT